VVVALLAYVAGGNRFKEPACCSDGFGATGVGTGRACMGPGEGCKGLPSDPETLGAIGESCDLAAEDDCADDVAMGLGLCPGVTVEVGERPGRDEGCAVVGCRGRGLADESDDFFPSSNGCVSFSGDLDDETDGRGSPFGRKLPVCSLLLSSSSFCNLVSHAPL
jgi:hypothetical protein